MEQTADPIVNSMVRQVAEMATFAKPNSRYRTFAKKAGHLEIDQEMRSISTPNAKPIADRLFEHVEAIFLARAADSIGFGSRSGICRSTADSQQRAIDISWPRRRLVADCDRRSGDPKREAAASCLCRMKKAMGYVVYQG